MIKINKGDIFRFDGSDHKIISIDLVRNCFYYRDNHEVKSVLFSEVVWTSEYIDGFVFVHKDELVMK